MKYTLSKRGKLFVAIIFAFAFCLIGAISSVYVNSFAKGSNGVSLSTSDGALLSATGEDVFYIDPEGKYGGSDDNSGLSPDTPIQSYQKASEIVSPTSVVYVMSTCYITEDTIIDLNYPTVELRRYKPEDPNFYEDEEWFLEGVASFRGHIFCTGEGNALSIAVVFDNFTYCGRGKFNYDEELTWANIIDGSYTDLTIKDVTIKELGLEGSILNLSNCHCFIYGMEILGGRTDGGVINIENSNLVIDDIFLVDTMNSNKSGLIEVTNSKVIINGGTFGVEGQGNRSYQSNYHYISVFNVAQGKGQIIVNGGNFSYNKIGIFSCLHNNGNNANDWLVINDGVFSNNDFNFYVPNLSESDGYGPLPSFGAIIDGGGNIVINGGVFENNSNVNAGGVINLYQGNLTINGGVFKNNTAACGGVIYCNLPQDEGKTRRANIVIRNAEFTGNSAVGGFTPSENFTLDYGNSETFVSGGAIFSTQPLTVDNCVFDGNSIQADIDSNLTLDCSGGAIYVRAIAQIINSSFSNNTTPRNSDIGVGIYTQGGAIAFFSGGVIQNCSFIGNGIGPHNGGALYLGDTETYVDNCYFEKNIASAYGGAIFGNATFTNCDFIRNKAGSIGGVAMLIGGGARFDNCVMEENVSLSCSALLLEAVCAITNCIIRNNVTTITDSASSGYKESKGAIGDCVASYDWNRLFLIGKNQIYGNKNSAELDEEGYPIIENGELIGGTEYNILIAFKWTNGDFYFNGVQSSGSTLGISFSGEQNADILNGIEPAICFGEGSPINSDILNCLVSDDPNYEFELRDGAIYLKKISGENEIIYTASDEITPYDGQGHNINIKVINPTNAKIRYKLNESDNYTDQAPELINVGSYTVYYEITAGGYSTVTGSRKVEITQNNTGLVDYVPNSNNVNTPITTIRLYYGETLAVGTDLTGRIGAGVIKDQNGNSVAGTFTANGTYNVTFDTNRINVKFTPTNPSYSECEFVAEALFEYEDLYFVNGAFYMDVNSNQQGTGVAIPRSVGLNKVISYMKPNSTIYFFDTYEITTDETLAVGKPITLSRYKFSRQVSTGTTETVVFTEEILNISSAGSLFIGGINATDKTSSLSKIIIDGQGYATLGSLKPLIVNNGDLRITGNLEIKGGYNTNESASGALAPGGAIYNTGKLFWVNVLISDCRYLNYVANISQFGAGGGAIYNTGTLDLINGSIQNCLARGGGAIYSSGTLNIDSLRFMGNNSSSRTMLGSETHAGHTIKLVGGKANISNTIITSSSISNGTTTGNQGSAEMVVDKIGGAIYVGKDAELFLSDTNISKCYAYQGGGLYVDGKVYMFSVVITSCSTKNGGQGIAVGTLGKLVAVNLYIARCTTTSTPDSSIGTTEKGVLTLNGGSSSLLSISYDGDEISSSSIDNTNNDYVFGVVLSVVVLGGFVAIGLVLNARKKGAKISLKSKRN